MNILELDEFEVMGIEYDLSNSLKYNIRLAQKHWIDFNRKLKDNRIHLGRNWCKYAFIQCVDERITYFIAVPKKEHVPQDFKQKTIPKSRYVKIEHTGNMNRLKNTVDDAYEIISKEGFSPKDTRFSYFERYDYRFHWNRPNSIIDIYLPLD